jgi:hypothetical protein
MCDSSHQRVYGRPRVLILVYPPKRRS